MRRELPNKLMGFTRKMDYVLAFACLLAAIFFAVKGVWNIAALWGLSAAISFIVAKVDLARRIVERLFLSKQRHAIKKS